MARKKTGKRQSGNPAVRAAQPMVELWPVAFHYFLEQQRILFYDQIEMKHVDGVQHVLLPEHGLVSLNEASVEGSTGGLADLNIFPDGTDYVAVLFRSEDLSSTRLRVARGDTVEERLDAMLRLVTEEFVDELGVAAAADFALAALQDVPVLMDPEMVREFVKEALIAAPALQDALASN